MSDKKYYPSKYYNSGNVKWSKPVIVDYEPEPNRSSLVLAGLLLACVLVAAVIWYLL